MFQLTCLTHFGLSMILFGLFTADPGEIDQSVNVVFSSDTKADIIDTVLLIEQNYEKRFSYKNDKKPSETFKKVSSHPVIKNDKEKRKEHDLISNWLSLSVNRQF